MQLILASSSRYRRELLERLGLPFEQLSPDIDESHIPNENPTQLAKRLSIAKAKKLAQKFHQHLIIGSDQTVECLNQTYNKPGNAISAAKQLSALSGNTAFFHTGICILDSASNRELSDVVSTKVVFRELDEATISRYLKQDQPYDCAGSFKAESLGIALFEAIYSDDPTALMGLPLIRLSQFLEQSGCPVI